MIIGLIGMSGAGKSSWASRLADAGFTWLHCDELIADRLRADFDVGAGTVYDLGGWMGLPHELHYAEREALYLHHETDVLRAIVEAVEQGRAPSGDLILDLTGSAVYIDPDVLGRLRRIATIVYLAVSPQLHDQMLRDYLANPRPVIWRGLYQPRPHEPPAETLTRCYPRLLADREQRYSALAHVTIEDALHRDPLFEVEQFLGYVVRNT